MDRIPEISTPRFILHQITIDDAADLFEFMSRQEMFQYVPAEPYKSEQDAVERINLWESAMYEDKILRWGITTKKDLKLIGYCGFQSWRKEHNRAELGTMVSPQSWGQGVLTEVLPAVLKYGFEVMKLHRIEALYDIENTASRKSLERCGFLKEGTIRDSFQSAGSYRSTAIVSLLSHEYKGCV